MSTVKAGAQSSPNIPTIQLYTLSSLDRLSVQDICEHQIRTFTTVHINFNNVKTIRPLRPLMLFFNSSVLQ